MGYQTQHTLSPHTANKENQLNEKHNFYID